MSTQTGNAAEDAAATYLAEHGYKILARNWRNRWCEIDIVAKKANVVHFVEVKYRATTHYGSATEYVTKTKKRQLKLAALNWVSEMQWEGDYLIDVVSIDESDADISFFENAIWQE